MRKILIAVAAAFGLSLMPSSARADLAPPVPPVKDVKFVVEVDEKAKAPKLIVPQNLTTVRIRPRPGGVPAKDKNEQVNLIELESAEVPIEPEPARPNPNHLMVAGVALTLGLGLGGVWLFRRQGRMGTRALAIMLAAGGSLVVTTLVWANAAPPPVKPPPAKERVLLPVAFNGNVSLEVVVGGDTIRLVLDKDTYEKLKEKPQEPERK
jgi:hypothetical protein